MAKATLARSVDVSTPVASSIATSVTPSLWVRDQNFPSGDQGISSLLIRYNGTMSGTSTPTRVTNGHIFYANAITVETDKHLKLWDSIDGLLGYIHNIFNYSTTGLATALTATPTDSDTPACSWIVPFVLFHGVRPFDTLLDMSKSRMKVSVQYGPGTNLWTQAGGSPLITGVTQSIESRIVPGPLGPTQDKESELPNYIRTFEQAQFPITATQSRFQIALPFGDRIYSRIYITQRNTSTKIEMSNVIDPTANISLYINNIPIVDKRRFVDIQAENKLKYSLESLPTGVCALDFDNDAQERIFDMLWALTLESGNMYLYLDVTTQTNASVLLGYECLKPIPPAAQRG